MPIKILIVEDEGIIAMSIELTLLDQGYQVVGIVDSGAAAIAQADALRPDLVLMDVVLQGEIDGLMAAEQIQSRLGIPIVFMTAFSIEAKINSGSYACASGHIRKPINPVQIDTVIKNVLS